MDLGAKSYCCLEAKLEVDELKVLLIDKKKKNLACIFVIDPDSFDFDYVEFGRNKEQCTVHHVYN